jgi:hypothetical protein
MPFVEAAVSDSSKAQTALELSTTSANRSVAVPGAQPATTRVASNASGSLLSYQAHWPPATARGLVTGRLQRIPATVGSPP